MFIFKPICKNNCVCLHEFDKEVKVWQSVLYSRSEVGLSGIIISQFTESVTQLGV